MKINEVVSGEVKKVTKVTGNKVKVADPKEPGVETEIDLDKVDVDADDAGNLSIDMGKKGIGSPSKKIKPNTNVTIKSN